MTTQGRFPWSPFNLWAPGARLALRARGQMALKEVQSWPYAVRCLRRRRAPLLVAHHRRTSHASYGRHHTGGVRARGSPSRQRVVNFASLGLEESLDDSSPSHVYGGGSEDSRIVPPTLGSDTIGEFFLLAPPPVFLLYVSFPIYTHALTCGAYFAVESDREEERVSERGPCRGALGPHLWPLAPLLTWVRFAPWNSRSTRARSASARRQC